MKKTASSCFGSKKIIDVYKLILAITKMQQGTSNLLRNHSRQLVAGLAPDEFNLINSDREKQFGGTAQQKNLQWFKWKSRIFLQYYPKTNRPAHSAEPLRCQQLHYC